MIYLFYFLTLLFSFCTNSFADTINSGGVFNRGLLVCDSSASNCVKAKQMNIGTPVDNGDGSVTVPVTGGGGGGSGGWDNIDPRVYLTTSTNNVGIGTAFPIYKLEVAGDAFFNKNTARGPAGVSGSVLRVQGADNQQVRVGITSFGTAGFPALATRAARGTAASPTNVITGDTVGSFESWGYGATGFSSSPSTWLRNYAAEAWTDTKQGAYTALATTPAGSAMPLERLRITDQGNVAIGSTISNYKLLVDGSAYIGNVNYPGIQTATQEPTGFVDRTNTISFNDSIRTFTITSDHTIYNNGVSLRPGTNTKQITDVTGMHYLYYNGTSAIQESTSFPTTNVALLANIYWNTDIDKALYSDERHGITMDWLTHDYLHSTIGTRYESGLTGTFTDSSFAITSGYIWDEDIRHTIGAQSVDTIIYKDGSADWKFDINQPLYYKTSGGNLQYNNGNTLTAAGSNKYIAAWIFATGDPRNPIVAMLGQREDTLLADARSNNTYESLSFGTLPYAEMKVLYRVILRNTATPYVETADYRSLSAVATGTFVASNHAALTNLNWSQAGHTFDTVLDVGSYNILTSGNVGIGTASPPVGLSIGTGSPTWTVAVKDKNDAYVVGDVEIDQALYVDGFIYGNGSKITGITQYYRIPISNPAAGQYVLPLETKGMSISAITCGVQDGTNMIGQIQECTGRTTATCADLDSDITCTTSAGADDGSLTDKTIAAGNALALKVTSVSGTVTQGWFKIEYTVIP